MLADIDLAHTGPVDLFLVSLQAELMRLRDDYEQAVERGDDGAACDLARRIDKHLARIEKVTNGSHQD